MEIEFIPLKWLAHAASVTEIVCYSYPIHIER